MAGESSQNISDCLGIQLIVQKIFNHFSNPELLQLSLVNNFWNYEARSLLTNRGTFIARIGKNNTCQDLRDFAVELRRMKVMRRIAPFSGMNIVLGGSKWTHEDRCNRPSTGELDQIYDDIVDQMTWRHLAVKFPMRWQECKNCPTFLLVKKIFQRHSSTLEELSFSLENKKEFIQEMLQDCSFPSLKTLRVLWGTPPALPGAIRPEVTFFIKSLVSNAPNLQVLYTEERVDLGANILEGTSAVHTSVYEWSPSLDQIPDHVDGEHRMTQMSLQKIADHLNVPRFNRITSKWLQISSQTLTSMDIAAIFLMPLTRYGICLPNVRMLRVRLSEGGLEIGQPRLWRLLKSFDFKRIFPNLSTITISWIQIEDLLPMREAFADMIEEENAAFIEPLPDRASNITTMNLQWFVPSILNYSTEFLVQMFPDIQKLISRGREMPSFRIWDSWLHLTELDITLLAYRYREHFDGVFCGIFPEEVAWLQQQSEEYLRQVHIVPVMPSMSCLTALKTFRFSFEDSPYYRRLEEDPTFVVSKVTGLTVFKRFPSPITLTMNDEIRRAALRHLTPYVSLVIQPLTP